MEVKTHDLFPSELPTLLLTGPKDRKSPWWLEEQAENRVPSSSGRDVPVSLCGDEGTLDRVPHEEQGELACTPEPLSPPRGSNPERSPSQLPKGKASVSLVVLAEQ